MARLFSISIPFQQKEYTALVSLREMGHDLCCIVRYVDSGLRHIMPGDKLVFSLQQGLQEPKTLPTDLAHSLVECTARALSDHLRSAG